MNDSPPCPSPTQIWQPLSFLCIWPFLFKITHQCNHVCCSFYHWPILLRWMSYSLKPVLFPILTIVLQWMQEWSPLHQVVILTASSKTSCLTFFLIICFGFLLAWRKNSKKIYCIYQFFYMGNNLAEKHYSLSFLVNLSKLKYLSIPENFFKMACG